jgi:CRP-like cAMP-binding protein
MFRGIAHSDPAIARAADTASAWIARQAQQFCACSACHRSSQRLSRWFLHIADRMTGDMFLATQIDAANALGVRRTTVTIEAKGLRAEGLIAYRRGRMRITNRDGLRANACECYGALAPEQWPFRCEADPAAPSIPATAAEREVA